MHLSKLRKQTRGCLSWLRFSVVPSIHETEICKGWMRQQNRLNLSNSSVLRDFMKINLLDFCVGSSSASKHLSFLLLLFDRFRGLVVRVLGYRSGGPGSIPGTTRKKVVGLERGPLSLVSTTEDILYRKVAAPV
jgi:hypothetical protein